MFVPREELTGAIVMFGVACAQGDDDLMTLEATLLKEKIDALYAYIRDLEPTDEDE
jgi:hypothetical protein